MRRFSLLLGATLISLSSIVNVNGTPEKIYGVNLGSWLVLEPWMLPREWEAMGGENCDPCTLCIRSEFDLAKAYPDTVDQKFEKHWETWFNQADVDELASLGINTVRIPLGYWIVEPLVDRKSEFFPRGGIKHLRRGLNQLKKAGIEVILDHHAAPGVQAFEQMFAGRCTPDVQFYTDENYQRALTWTAVMTTLSHIDPAFSTVFAIQAVNEPLMDAYQTPGYGEFQKNFVLTVRIVEAILGIWTFDDDDLIPRLLFPGSQPVSLSDALRKVAADPDCYFRFPGQALKAVADAAPIVEEILRDEGYGFEFGGGRTNKGIDVSLRGVLDVGLHFGSGSFKHREALYTNFMDRNWQYNSPPNPADAAIGPIGFDNHLYYSFGGVADPYPEAYLIHICNLKRVENDRAFNNTPLWFGEWALPTQFNASDEFLRKWADAQKIAYGRGSGWIFWNFKIESGQEIGREWSYTEGVRRGYLTPNPADLFDPHVCDPYYNQTFTATATTTEASSTTTSTTTTTRLVTTTTTEAPYTTTRTVTNTVNTAQVTQIPPPQPTTSTSTVVASGVITANATVTVTTFTTFTTTQERGTTTTTRSVTVGSEGGWGDGGWVW
ncbi:hypothetical protein PQX77_019979 [Marasmius sp. AFHP31]|nr:hypothetical protein PQX77_019979 [Marasmius sp. AFHP31]